MRTFAFRLKKLSDITHALELGRAVYIEHETGERNRIIGIRVIKGSMKWQGMDRQLVEVGYTDKFFVE